MSLPFKFKKIWGVGFVFQWFLLGGLVHFIRPGFFLPAIPPSLPYPLALIYISGAFELLGAAGLLLPRWRESAGNGLMLLTVSVTPVNIYMWQHPQLFAGIPEPLLTLRLLIQVLLLICIWRCTRADDTPKNTL